MKYNYIVFSFILASLWTIALMTSPFSFQNVFAQGEQPATVVEGLNWTVQAGDWVYVDVSTNQLRLVRGDHSAVSEAFGVGSGYNDGRKMSYLGMYYDPATPVDEWMILSKNQQSTCWIFCANRSGNKDQTFLRFYRLNEQNGQYEYSHYGLHSTPNFESIRDNFGGFGSWGCVLADYELLKLVESVYDHHQEFGEGLKVVTEKTVM